MPKIQDTTQFNDRKVTPTPQKKRRIQPSRLAISYPGGAACMCVFFFLHFDSAGQGAGEVVHGRTLGARLVRPGLLQPQASPLDDGRPAVDGVVAEAVDAQRVLPPQHLPGADGVEDLELVGGEALGVDDGLAFDLGFDLGLGLRGGFRGGGGERGGGLGLVGQHGAFHLLEHRFVLLRGVVFERVEAEVDGLGDLVLAELAAHVRRSLYDWRIGLAREVFGPRVREKKGGDILGLKCAKAVSKPSSSQSLKIGLSCCRICLRALKTTSRKRVYPSETLLECHLTAVFSSQSPFIAARIVVAAERAPVSAR